MAVEFTHLYVTSSCFTVGTHIDYLISNQQRMFENLVIPANLDANDSETIPFLSITDEEDDAESKKKNALIPQVLPLLALKNTVLFPGVVIPITIGREKSIKAVRHAFKTHKFIGVFSQKDIKTTDPTFDDLYNLGTTAKIIKLLKMPDGNTTAILQGRIKCRLNSVTSVDPYMEGNVESIQVESSEDVSFKATIQSIKESAKKIIDLTPQIPNEAGMMLYNIKTDAFLLNFVASNLNISVEEKQKLLAVEDIVDKAAQIHKRIDSQLQMLELKGEIESKVRGDIEKQQKEYFLNQQLKTIQNELGDNPQQEVLNELELKSKDKKWSETVAKHFKKQLDKAKRLNPQVADYSVTLNYLELLLELPWDTYTEDNFDLKEVMKVLDKDHYGLDDVKERIIEHLAVLKLKGDMKAPILLLVGPPGVGKTSLGKSIARAVNRKFIRMSLGGLTDESEIRGHRKTYIGAMPGRILQSLKKAGSSNPVFILDEIDKIGKDFRGDPSSALLEVLDPEQNATFYDNYVEQDYDLSKVMFIATANSLSTIQPALLDRMEIIQVSGYSTEEKIEIAKDHLIPKQLKEHGLKKADAKFSNKTIAKVIGDYTRESGVRSLERKIAGVLRNVAKKKALEEEYNQTIKEEDIPNMIGPEKFNAKEQAKIKTPGVAIGLAWTRVGGDILYIETSLSKGKGKLLLTGNLGDVMKESATTALSYVKAHAEEIGIDAKLLEESDVHIHVPQGAIPKDGPSAGVTMMSAISSAFLGRKIKSGLAMSGEITLRGKVLPVGGIKEKVLAAKRSGLKTILLCKVNEKDVLEINADYVKGITFKYVETMEEVLDIVLI